MLLWQKSVQPAETGKECTIVSECPGLSRMAGVATGLSRLFKAGGLEVKLFLRLFNVLTMV